MIKVRLLEYLKEKILNGSCAGSSPLTWIDQPHSTVRQKVREGAEGRGEGDSWLLLTRTHPWWGWWRCSSRRPASFGKQSWCGGSPARSGHCTGWHIPTCKVKGHGLQPPVNGDSGNLPHLHVAPPASAMSPPSLGLDVEAVGSACVLVVVDGCSKDDGQDRSVRKMNYLMGKVLFFPAKEPLKNL